MKHELKKLRLYRSKRILNSPSMDHLRKIKYTIIALSALFLTIIEIYYYFRGVPIIDNIIDWFIGMVGAIILIEIAFRAVANLQDKLEMEISKRKRTEEQLLQVNEVLKLINKNLRHDILNDLSVVLNSLQMYSETKDENLIRYATKAIERSIELITRMRELETLILSNGSLRPSNVREIVEEVVSNYRTASQIEFNIEGNCTVMADEALGSVIENIIRNAIRHGGANRIDIKLEGGSSCRIKIADNGKGIPVEIKESIFDEGFSYGAHRGSGLGLYIVKKTIERYGGSIHVENNKPKGAVFVITLNCPDFVREGKFMESLEISN